MRRLALLAAITTLAGVPAESPASTIARAAEADCTDYCGERAAENCDRIDGWYCAWYILGCLAGCNIAQL